MKKLAILLAFFAMALSVRSQNNLYTEVVSIIKKNYPGIAANDKLIAVSFWSSDDEQSRSANRAFDKAMRTYEVAKLSGGRRGFVAVAISLDDLSDMALDAFVSDGVVKMLSLKRSDLQNVKYAGMQNIVFNSDGVIVYENLKPEAIFNTIQNLITR